MSHKTQAGTSVDDVERRRRRLHNKHKLERGRRKLDELQQGLDSWTNRMMRSEPTIGVGKILGPGPLHG